MFYIPTLEIIKKVLQVEIKEQSGSDKYREIIRFYKTNKFQNAQIDYLQKYTLIMFLKSNIISNRKEMINL